MVEADVPSLAEWAGGPDAFRRLTAIFYRNVARDPLLGPVFGAYGSRTIPSTSRPSLPR